MRMNDEALPVMIGVKSGYQGELVRQVVKETHDHDEPHLLLNVHLLFIDDLSLELCEQIQQWLSIPCIANERVL